MTKEKLETAHRLIMQAAEGPSLALLWHKLRLAADIIEEIVK